MASITDAIDDNGDKVYNVDLENDDEGISLATANTYVDKNIVINIPLSEKANLSSPDFTGSPTINNEKIATKLDVVDHLTVTSENIVDENNIPGIHTTFYVSDDAVTDFTIMNGDKGERGTSILHIQTAP